MPKYYVQSGNQQAIVSAKSGKAACRKALESFREDGGDFESEFFFLNEQGFRCPSSFSVDTDTMDMDDNVYRYSYINDDFEHLSKKR